MKNTIITTICILLALSLSGCAIDRNPLQSHVNPAYVNPTFVIPMPLQATEALADLVQSPPPSPTTLEPVVIGEQLRASRIAEIAATIPGVHKATAVIAGKTSIIGITIADTLPGGLLSLKRDVEKAVLAMDAELSHTTITASEELFTRISNMPDSGHSAQK